MTSKIFKPTKIVPLIASMKWKLYARAIYWYEFFFLILLMGAFLTEIFLLHYSKTSKNTKKIAGNILHVAISILLLGFIKTEIR